MDTDEIAPPPKKAAVPVNLEVMSITELEAHIASLQAEIERTRQMITKKQAARGAADSFFKR